MAQLSPQRQQRRRQQIPQAQPETEAEARDEDLALADSFFNYDYVPDMSPQRNRPDPDLIEFGSGGNRVEELPEAEAEAEGVVNLGDLGLCGGIEEGIEKISLVGGGDGDNDDDKGHESEDSSSSSSSTSSESESDSSDDDGKEEERNDDDDDVKSELEEGEIVESDDDDDDRDDVSDSYDRRIRSKNELEILLPSIPPVNVTLEPHHRMLPVGLVMSVLGDQVIVEGVEKHEPLNEGSILWMTESRKLLGLIDEIFGPVKNPYYVVRYNSENEVPKGIQGGNLISFVPEFANHVLNNKELYEQGYDYDEEASVVEFSDDEKEAEYMKRKERMAKRGSNGQNHGNRKNKGKKFPAEGVASAAPFYDHGNCSTFSGNGQGSFGARVAAPAATSHDQGHSSTFSGDRQVPFGATTVAPAAPWNDQGHPSIFSGNGQGPFGPRIVAPAAPFHGQGQSSTFSSNGQGPFGAPTVVPPFPPANTGPNLNTTAVWPNGAMLPQPQPALLPNVFPSNGMPWFPANTQMSHQLPVPGVPFQQLLNPNQVLALANMFPTQPMFPQGLGVQNQMPFGSISPSPQVPQPLCPAQQGFPSSAMQPQTNPNVVSGSLPFNPQAPQTNHNVASGSIPFNPQGPPHQFYLGGSSNHGRKKFHPGGRKGWRSAR